MEPLQSGTGVKVLVVGICGATCSGKTSVVERLCQRYKHTLVFHQDDYYLEEENAIPKTEDDSFHWDVPEALNRERLVSEVTKAIEDPFSICPDCKGPEPKPTITNAIHLLLLEGTMILELSKLKTVFEVSVFIKLDRGVCFTRRCQRDYGEHRDPAGYFERYLWPAYHKLEVTALKDERTVILDGRSNSVEELTDAVSKIIDDNFHLLHKQ